MLPSFRGTPGEALAVASEAEDRGLDGVFVYDHLWPMGQPERPAIAPFPLLGAVAATTSVLHLGTLVARVEVIPDELLVAEFAALDHMAPGRVIAALGTGDHLSFAENEAYGVPLRSASDRRASLGSCARALLGLGLQVWIGGLARATVAVAEEVGAVANFWQADPETVATQAARSPVTWAGMATPGRPDADLDAAAIVALARPLVTAGANWLVFGWPVDLVELASAARAIHSD